MVRIWISLCYTCRTEGELVFATGSYQISSGGMFDVCDKHLAEVKEDGFPVHDNKGHVIIESKGLLLYDEDGNILQQEV